MNRWVDCGMDGWIEKWMAGGWMDTWVETGIVGEWKDG